MLLQTILFGEFVPPTIADSHIHRIGLSGGNRYYPPKQKVVSQKDGLNDSEQKIFAVIKKYNFK